MADEEDERLPRLQWYRRVSAWLLPVLPLLIPLVTIVGFQVGRMTERNMSLRTPTVKQIKLDDSSMRDKSNVNHLLARYGIEMSSAAQRFETQAKRSLSFEEKGVYEWMHGVTLHPCPLPDDMLRIHADAVLRASRELVLVKPQ